MILSQVPPQNFQQLGGVGTVPRNQVFQQSSFTKPPFLSSYAQDLTRTTTNLPQSQQSYQFSSLPFGSFPQPQTQNLISKIPDFFQPRQFQLQTPPFTINNNPSTISREQQQIYPIKYSSPSVMQFNTSNEQKQPYIRNRNQQENQQLFQNPSRFSPLPTYTSQIEHTPTRSYDSRPTYTESSSRYIEISENLNPVAKSTFETRLQAKPIERVNTSQNELSQSIRPYKSYLSPIVFGERSPIELSYPYQQQSYLISSDVSSSFVLPFNTTQNQEPTLVSQSNEQENLKERNINFLFQSKDKDFLKDYLRAIVDMERNIENNRIKIVREEDYSVQLFYELFDRNESGQVTIPEIIAGLKKLGINAEVPDVKLLISRYSSNNQNSILDQQEFINMIVPRSYKHIDSIFVRKPYVNETNMKENTRQLMNKIMKSLLNAEVVLEQMRVAIEESKIDLKQLFFQISEDSTAPVNKQFLREYLINQGIFVNREKISLTLQRFDLKDLGYFREQDFIIELKPRRF